MSKIALHGTKIEALRFQVSDVRCSCYNLACFFCIRLNDAVHFAIILRRSWKDLIYRYLHSTHSTDACDMTSVCFLWRHMQTKAQLLRYYASISPAQVIFTVLCQHSLRDNIQKLLQKSHEQSFHPEILKLSFKGFFRDSYSNFFWTSSTSSFWECRLKFLPGIFQTLLSRFFLQLLLGFFQEFHQGFFQRFFQRFL